MANKSVIKMPKIVSKGTKSSVKKPLSNNYLQYKAYIKNGGKGPFRP